MGTQQQLTTQQTELLILIKEYHDYYAGDLELLTRDEIVDNISESEIMEPDESRNALDALEYYGYLDDDYELTTDGRQYIELFQEYLLEKANNSNAEHNSFNLINIENMDMAFAKVDLLGGWAKLLGGIKGKR